MMNGNSVSGVGGNHSPPPPYSDPEVKVAPGQSSNHRATAGGDQHVVYPPAPQFGSNVPYPPAAPCQTPIVVTGCPVVGARRPQTTFISARTAMFGPFPVEMDCPYCEQHIVTHTTKVPGIMPWIICAVCVVLGIVLIVPWCLCCLPFCIDSCLDVVHSCPSCKRYVGKFSRL